jgi:L-threonylcarbamoyladenylate synthase
MSMNIETATTKIIERGAELIRQGQLVAFPTETVYGLGADATNDAAVAEIFAAKGRPSFNPLIIHVNGIAMAKEYVQWNALAEKLAMAFWPGPLTLVLPRIANSRISLLASAGGDTLGVRMPQHDVALALIAASGKPVAAPSANRSGRVSPTTAKHVGEEFGSDLKLILDGGACKVGVESTVLDVTGDEPVLLRPGGVAREAIESMLGRAIATLQEKQAVLKSPGMLDSHYAPSLPVRLNITAPLASEALIAFGDEVPKGAKRVINLSDSGNDKQAAARLFSVLRELDSPDYSAIAVMPIPDAGLGAAINDRLRRAAAERP